MCKDMYVSTFPGDLKQVGLGLVLFPIYSKMHYGFNYVGSKHLHPSTHTKPARHGKRHDTANNTVTHIVGLPWSNISNFKRAVGLAMMKGLYALCTVVPSRLNRRGRCCLIS